MANDRIHVALLTGGGDRPYVYGLSGALSSRGIAIDMIGSDDLDLPELRSMPGVTFLNLRGSHRSDASFVTKTLRVLRYYLRLMRYAATARPKIFHVLWNNKFEHLDRTLLMMFYALFGRRVVLTVHNVNAAKRDGVDSALNRLTLRAQYHLAARVFVHTEKMKAELAQEFGVGEDRIEVIPFGINNSVPQTELTSSSAKRRLGLDRDHRTILFFGRITPYKGLEYLVSALRQISEGSEDYRLVIAGRPDRCEQYWNALRQDIEPEVQSGRIILRDSFIPDDETEIYFKAADVLVLPYRHIYQSGVLFLGHGFGLPVLASDVGSLADDIVEGENGFVFRPEDPADLGRALRQYFSSDLYRNLDARRHDIRVFADERHSWDTVGDITETVYRKLLAIPHPVPSPDDTLPQPAANARPL